MTNLATNIRPDILFHSNGLIEISSKISILLCIEHGAVINIFEEKGEHYLYVAHKNPAGTFKGRCRKAKKTGRFMRANWIELSRSIIALTDAPEAHYRVGDPQIINGKKVLPIITRNNLYAKRN